MHLKLITFFNCSEMKDNNLGNDHLIPTSYHEGKELYMLLIGNLITVLIKIM